MTEDKESPKAALVTPDRSGNATVDVDKCVCPRCQEVFTVLPTLVLRKYYFPEFEVSFRAKNVKERISYAVLLNGHVVYERSVSSETESFFRAMEAAKGKMAIALEKLLTDHGLSVIKVPE